MKKIFYFTAFVFLAFLQWGCHEDKGNYDYVNFEDITVDVTSEIYEYRTSFGEHLVIPMTVTTDVPESELEYTWEVGASSRFSTFAEGKDLDYVVEAGHFPEYGTFFARLKVARQMKGYAAAVFSPLIRITVSGESGLMVLHGNDSESDIATITHSDFIIRAGTQVAQNVVHNLYSSSNNGGKIPGKGITVIQQHTRFISADFSDIYVITDRTSLVAVPAGLVKKSDYLDIFHSLPGYSPLCKGDPQRFQFFNSSRVILDGGDLFVMNGTTNPKFSMRNEFNGLPNYKISKHSYLNTTSYMFEENMRGFISASTQNAGTLSYVTYNSTKGPFNVGDMQADLLFLDRGAASASNYMGVFKEDDGTIFIGEINFAARDEVGNTFAHDKYDIADLPEFESAKFYAVGANSSLCYYATGTSVYQYALLGQSKTTTGKKLVMGTEQVPFSGEVTMMKVLRPLASGADTYQYHNQMLLVGTYENGVGTLHAIILDLLSGSALSHKTFTGFGRIADANLKSL